MIGSSRASSIFERFGGTPDAWFGVGRVIHISVC